MIDIISPLIKEFLPFAQKHMGFSDPPRLFLRGDATNAQKPLGKTAFYDPQQKSITIYIMGRHPKDVMRSLSHELVHHTQNCRGDFKDVGEMGEGYAQNDEHLREMEREAYETGNMCFRDWEDSIKQTIYFEHLQKGEKKMSIKDWKNGELTTILSEAFGFKFNPNALNEGADKNTGMSGVKGDDDDDTYMGHVKEDEEVKEGFMDTMRKVGRKVSPRSNYRDTVEYLQGVEDSLVKWNPMNSFSGVELGAANAKDSAEGLGIDLSALASTARTLSKSRQSKDDMGDEDLKQQVAGLLKQAKATVANWDAGKKMQEGDTGASKGDESKTHKGEKDYTTKKDDELKTSGKGRGEKKGDKAYVNEDSGEEEGHHYDDNRMSDDDHIKAIEHHLDALRHDRDYDDDHIDEGGAAARTGNEEKDNGRNRMHADRVHEDADPLREAIRTLLAKHLKS